MERTTNDFSDDFFVEFRPKTPLISNDDDDSDDDDDDDRFFGENVGFFFSLFGKICRINLRKEKKIWRIFGGTNVLVPKEPP